MTFVLKILEYLLENNLIAALSSFVFGLILEVKLPFPKNVNFELGLAVWMSICFLLISLIRLVYREIKNIKFELLSRRKTRILKKKHKEETIDRIKCQVDNLSAWEYSVVIFLLRNRNKIPYKEIGEHKPGTILDNTQFFNRIECNEKKKIEVQTVDGKKEEMTVEIKNQFLLTADTYKVLQSILESTGSISHYKKDEVDLMQ